MLSPICVLLASAHSLPGSAPLEVWAVCRHSSRTFKVQLETNQAKTVCVERIGEEWGRDLSDPGPAEGIPEHVRSDPQVS